MALNVAMAMIAISIPALIYAGCIMTRKKKSSGLPKVASRHEFDRAA